MVSNLKMEVQILEDRCDGHEMKIKDLESRCNMHERIIEMLWKEIVGLKDSQNGLSTAYMYDLIPQLHSMSLVLGIIVCYVLQVKSMSKYQSTIPPKEVFMIPLAVCHADSKGPTDK